MGTPIALTYEAFVTYARTHEFLEQIACFCVLRSGQHTSVKLIRPRDKDNNTFFIGCFHWTPAGAGCRYMGTSHILLMLIQS